MRVLLVSASYDPHADVLASRIEHLGGTTGRFNIDSLPQSIWSKLEVSNEAVNLAFPDGTTDADAVYYRRLAMIRGHGLWRHIPENTRQFVVSEAESTLFGLCYALHDRPWINHYASLETHINKPAGLIMARTVGMSIPDTVVTNDPDLVEDLYGRHKGKIIFKAASTNAVRMTDEYSALLYTSRIKPEHLARPDLIRAVPGIYQEEIERQDELRVTVVDEDIFAARVIPAYPEEVDWRRGLGQGTTFEPYSLPDEFCDKLLAFMKLAGLRYGAFDFMVRPNGDIVFLEVNPQGAYLWLERELSIPVTDAIAHALMKG